MEGPFRRTAPPLGLGSVVRPRLLGALVRRFDVPLVVIEAAGGFGKSTLLAQALQENRLAPRGRDAWLTCEPADASARSLLGGIVSTLGGSVGPDIDVMSAAEAIWSASPVEVALVLDDVHVIEPGSEGEEALAGVLAALPANGHLVLAGRRLPALSMARLAAQDRLVRIGEDDLRFTDGELEEYAQQAGIDVERLERAAGWPALVALRSSARAEDSNAFVSEEVVAGLDPTIRRALAVAALLGGGDAELLSMATGDAVDLDGIGRIPLVVRTADDTIHVHGLWGELLDGELDEGERAAVRSRAAKLLVARAVYGRAFELLAASSLWPEARTALVDACTDQAQPPTPDQLRRWQAMIPPDELGPGPAAFIDALVARADAAWSVEARDHFARAMAGFADEGDIANELRVGLRAAYVAWKREELDETKAFRHRLEELGDLIPDNRRIAALNEATRADIDGDDQRLLEVLAGLDTSGMEPRVAYFLPLLRADAQVGAGDLDAARESAAEAAKLAAGLVPAAGALSALLRPVLVAWCAHERRALDDPMLAADPGPAVARDERAETLAWGVIAAAHRGDQYHASSMRRELDSIVEGVDLPGRPRGLVALARASEAVARGDECAAAAELSGVLDPRVPAAGTTWRAARWHPGVAAALDDERGRVLETMIDTGPGRDELDAAARIRALRTGDAASPAGALLDDVDRVVCAFPLPLAVELAVGALLDDDDRGHVCLEHYVRAKPSATREALQGLAGGKSRAAKAARDVLAVMPIPPDEPVRVEVLGAARLWRGDAVVDDADWRRERVRALLLLLVVRGEVRREEAAALLWPDLDEKKASANLRLTLHYVQTVLEPRRAGREAPYFVAQDAGFLRLQGHDRLAVDAWELARLVDEAHAAEAAGAPSRALELLLEAIGLWRGEPLEDVAFAEWAMPSREALHARCVAAGVRAAELLLGAGRDDEALDVAERVLRAEPWCEPAYRVQLSAHLAAGNRAAALRALESCRAMLDDLGVEPDPETEMLARRATAGAAATGGGSR
jgi:LuxR family transcriptional regulator, maltose regulon positive regulatory protein